LKIEKCVDDEGPQEEQPVGEPDPSAPRCSLQFRLCPRQVRAARNQDVAMRARPGFAPASFVRQNSIVKRRPSSRLTFGVQPKTVFAFVESP
jgi:hypothetical protein